MEEIDLKELLMLFWQKKVKIILILAIFTVLGIIYTETCITPMYTSSTTLVLATSEDETSKSANTITTTDITLNSKLISTYSELVKSNNVIRQVISNLGIDLEEENLRKNIKVTSVTDTELIKISVSNESAQNAAKIANEISKVFIEKVSEIYNIKNVHIVDNAEISETPSNVNKPKDIGMFTCIGIVVSVLYVIIANMFDTTIKTEEEIEKEFKIPVLCSIPLHNFNDEKGGGKKK